MLNAGEYVFSSFIASINSKIDLSSFANWSDNDKAVITHEFLHFYQNCSTVYGYICIKHIADVVASIATQKDMNIRMPINPKDYLEIPQLLHNLRYCPEQDWDSVNMILGCSIKPIDGELKTAIQNSPKTILKQQVFEKAVLKVGCSCRGIQEYIFDGIALCESMVAMIEKKLFPKTPCYKSSFPYCVAKEVAEHLQPQISWDDDCLILLCDLCLDTFDPGVYFIKFLKNVDKQTKKIDARDVFNYFENMNISIFSESSDQMINMTRDEYREKVIEDAMSSLKNMITNSYYESAFTWISEGMRAFFVIRDQLLGMQEKLSRYFPYNWDWLVSMLSFSYPIFKTENVETMLPEFFVLGNITATKDVQWQYWDGMNRFLRLISSKYWRKLFCPFFTFCNYVEIESCSLDPFRLYGSENCRFQHYMSIFNLENKKLYGQDENPIISEENEIKL